jgi:hypothetical protein
MVCCIAGMHRTGTSMVARLLNLCGLDLGPAADLVPPAPDNPEGFWENVHFALVNDLILRALGGSWDAPPGFPPAWERRAELDDLAAAATQLLEHFANREPWGWKDPRNSLTIPFWRRIIPDLQIVVCVRNPIEVARSLRERDGCSIAFGLELWRRYYQQLLANVPAERRVVTHYASYFDDPQGEIRRVLDRLALHPADSTIARAEATITRRLWHQHTADADLLQAGASPEILRLYRCLVAEAAPPLTEQTPFCPSSFQPHSPGPVGV